MSRHSVMKFQNTDDRKKILIPPEKKIRLHIMASYCPTATRMLEDSEATPSKFWRVGCSLPWWLRILHWHLYGLGHCFGLGYCYGASLISGPGTSTCHGHSTLPPQPPQKKKKSWRKFFQSIILYLVPSNNLVLRTKTFFIWVTTQNIYFIHFLLENY